MKFNSILYTIIGCLSFLGCSNFNELPREWIETDNGLKIWTVKNDTVYNWSGSSFDKIAHGEGQLIGVYKNDTVIRKEFKGEDSLSFGFLDEDEIIELPEDEYFYGNTLNSKFNGFGIYAKNNGQTLVGNFKNNLPHGLLKVYKNDTLKFEGHWKDGKKNGIGNTYQSNGNVKIYTWVNNIKDDNDVKITLKNGVYEGGVNKGVQHGYGTFIYKDSLAIYKGDWFNGQMHGKGVYEDDNLYIKGEFEQGFLNGFAEIETNQFYFSGTLKNQKFNGSGQLSLNTGALYDGNFKEGVYHGDGLLELDNGETYAGSWLNGKRSGFGEYNFSDNETYIGDWLNDKQNGEGILTTKDFEYTGDFKNGEANGFGEIKYTNSADLYIGNFKDSKKSGYGIYTFESGNKYEGEFKDNTFNGIGKFVFTDGNVFEGEFQDGVFFGQGSLYINNEKGVSVITAAWNGSKLPTEGSVLLPNGDLYTGPLLNGYPTENGSFTTEKQRIQLKNKEKTLAEVKKESKGFFREKFEKHKDNIKKGLSIASKTLEIVEDGAFLVGTAALIISPIFPPAAAVSASAYAIGETAMLASVAVTSTELAVEVADIGLQLHDTYVSLNEKDKKVFFERITTDFMKNVKNIPSNSYKQVEASYDDFEKMDTNQKLTFLGGLIIEYGPEAFYAIRNYKRTFKKSSKGVLKTISESLTASVKKISKISIFKFPEKTQKIGGVFKLVQKSNISPKINFKQSIANLSVRLKSFKTKVKSKASKARKKKKKEGEAKTVKVPFKLKEWCRSLNKNIGVLKTKVVLKSSKKSKGVKSKSSANKRGYMLKPNKRSISVLKDGVKKATIFHLAGKYVLTATHYNTDKQVNHILYKPLLQNATYKVNNVIYKTDIKGRPKYGKIGRIRNLASIINRDSLKGIKESQIAKDFDRINGKDDGGHLIAHTIGGAKAHINIVPQLYKMNRGVYKIIETFVKKHASYIKDYKVKVSYPANSLIRRPDDFSQSFYFYGSNNILKNLKKEIKVKYGLNLQIKEDITSSRKVYKCKLKTSNSIFLLDAA